MNRFVYKTSNNNHLMMETLVRAHDAAAFASNGVVAPFS